MGLLRSTQDGIRALRDKSARNDEIDEELESFLGESINEKMRRGMTAEDALRAARAEVGSAQAVKHKAWRPGWETRGDLLWKEFTTTLRRLSRLPGLVF